MTTRLALTALLASLALSHPQAGAQPAGGPAPFSAVRLQPPAGAGSAAQFGTKVAIDGVRVAVSAPGINEVDVFALGAGNPRIATLGLQPPPRAALAPFLAQLGLPRNFPIQSFGFGVPLAYANDTLVTMTGNLVEPRPNVKFGLPDTVQVFRRGANAFKLQTQFVAFPGFQLGIALLGDRLVAARVPLNGDPAVSGTLQLLDLAGNVVTSLAPTSAPTGSRFGEAIAASGNTIVVGAPGDVGAKPGGSIYVFDLTGDALTQIAKIDEPNGANADFFGRSVAVDGNTIAVGSGRAGGSAFLYTRAGNNVSLAQTISVRDGAAPFTFATNVALSGLRLVVANQSFRVVGGAAQEPATSFSAYRQGSSGAPFRLSARFTDVNQGTDLTSALALSGNALIAGGATTDGGTGAAAAFVVP